MTFLIVAAGSAVGTVIANGLLLWLLGRQAQKAQKQQAEALAELEAMFIAEQERIQRYAAMES
jgi:hypothetical protein